MDKKIEPTKKEDVHKKGKAYLWDLKAARIMDLDRIKGWLREDVSNKVSGNAGSKNLGKIKLMQETLLESYKRLSLELEGMYNLNQYRGLDKVLKDAEKGVFEEKAPTIGAITGWYFSLFLAGSLEITFFSYMVFFQGAGGLLIGMAVLLLVGGLLAGHGSAQIMLHSQKNEYESSEVVNVDKKNIVLLLIGVIIIAAVTVLRYVYGGPLAGIIAVLFGLAVITSEAYLSYYKDMRKYYLDKMWQAQEYYAALNLWNDLKEPGEYKDDSWYVMYEDYLKEAMGVYKNFSDLESKSKFSDGKPEVKVSTDKSDSKATD